MREERPKAIDEARGPWSRAGGILCFFRDKLLASGWVMGYAIVLAIFQVVKRLESVLKNKGGGANSPTTNQESRY
jgi:hypothetical protein